MNQLSRSLSKINQHQWLWRRHYPQLLSRRYGVFSASQKLQFRRHKKMSGLYTSLNYLWKWAAIQSCGGLQTRQNTRSFTELPSNFYRHKPPKCFVNARLPYLATSGQTCATDRAPNVLTLVTLVTRARTIMTTKTRIRMHSVFFFALSSNRKPPFKNPFPFDYKTVQTVYR